MPLLNWLREQNPWRRNESQSEERHKLLMFLCEAYRQQSENVASFTHHAELMYYPHLRDRLLQVVEEEQTHLQWLARHITALGGTVPQPSASPRSGTNTWENLRLDVAAERRDDEAFLTGVRIAEHVDRDMADGLVRLRQDEQKHAQLLRDLWQKSEPDAVATPPSQSQAMERQKQTWLAQQKMAWLEQRRAQWQAAAKPTPWAEWLARREYEWTVNELPNRELHWSLQLTTQAATESRVARVAEKL